VGYKPERMENEGWKNVVRDEWEGDIRDEDEERRGQ
jgi:hypothetical protein